jgi:hypothetical protein
MSIGKLTVNVGTVFAYGQQMSYPSCTQFSANMQVSQYHEFQLTILQAPQKLAARAPSIFVSSTAKELICMENHQLYCYLFSDLILILHKMAVAEKYLDLTLILPCGKCHFLP